MKPRARSIGNLYFRWGRRAGLNAEEVAQALEEVGLIERLEGFKYRERDGPKIDKGKYNAMVLEVLEAFKRGRGI